MHNWFVYLFEQRMNEEHYVFCFECGCLMHEDTYKENTCCYSHILEKAKYKQHKGDPDNVVIVHPQCHTLYTVKPTKAINQYNLSLKLKEQYGI